LKEAWGVPALGTAAAAIVLMVCAGVALSSREQASTFAAERQPEAVAPVEVAAVSNVAPTRPNAYDVVKTDGEGVAGAAAKQSATGATDVNKHAPRAQTVMPRLATTHINVIAPKDEPVSQGEDALALTIPPERGGAVAAESSPWDARRLRRLAEVQRVVLKMDDATALDKEQADDLLASIKEALKELGIVALTDETEKRPADGIMLLRFEPDTTLLGAIFATMRDRDGNFLWEDHAGCRVMPDDSGWGATFDDASARLISKLQPRTKVASNHGDEKPQSVTGSKYSRSLLRQPPTAPGFVIDAPGYEKGRVTMNQVVTYERK
jgi:hypothetical protein